MPRVSSAFFTVAALCGLSGMIWGSYMGATHDHAMMPAHAHLNLLGWVTLSIMGGYYALPGNEPRVLAWVNFVLSALGAILTAVLLPQVLTEKLTGAVMPIAEAPVILGMICFLISVISGARRPAA